MHKNSDDFIQISSCSKVKVFYVCFANNITLKISSHMHTIWGYVCGKVCVPWQEPGKALKHGIQCLFAWKLHSEIRLWFTVYHAVTCFISVITARKATRSGLRYEASIIELWGQAQDERDRSGCFTTKRYEWHLQPGKAKAKNDVYWVKSTAIATASHAWQMYTITKTAAMAWMPWIFQNCNKWNDIRVCVNKTVKKCLWGGKKQTSFSQ